MAGDNGSPTPEEITIRYQVIVNIDSLDRIMIVAPELTMDRADIIMQRAADYTRRERDAERFVQAMEQARQNRNRIVEGVPRPPASPFDLR